MGDFKTLLQEAKVADLHNTTENGRVKFLCFTRVHDNAMVLGVSDGVDVWRLELDSEEIDIHRDLAGVSTVDAFLSKFRQGLTSGDLSVARIGNKVTLTVGHGQDVLMFDLFEATATERRTELQLVLFRLADLASSLETKLSAANKTIDTLKTQNATTGLHQLMELGPKKGATKSKPKKVGMSVVNPTSKKRKAAQGVVFD